MVFNTYFNSISAISLWPVRCTYPCFPEILLTSTLQNILPKPLVLPHVTIVEILDRSERRMNPVAMTIINPRKEYWLSQGSNHGPPVFKSAPLWTEPWDLALMIYE